MGEKDDGSDSCAVQVSTLLETSLDKVVLIFSNPFFIAIFPVLFSCLPIYCLSHFFLFFFSGLISSPHILASYSVSSFSPLPPLFVTCPPHIFLHSISLLISHIHTLLFLPPTFLIISFSSYSLSLLFIQLYIYFLYLHFFPFLSSSLLLHLHSLLTLLPRLILHFSPLPLPGLFYSPPHSLLRLPTGQRWKS